MLDALVISDIHLGSDVCQAKPLVEFLEYARRATKKLILNGDVFESIDMRRLKKHHWHVLSVLRKMSDEIDVIWISGNHDGPADIISQLLGITVLPEYILESGLYKILLLHGDRFDKFTTERPFITWIGDMLYLMLQKIDKSHYWARLAKNSSKHYLHCLDIVKEKSIQYAHTIGCDLVCCGHTHFACAEHPYYNSGCWTEKPSTYLEVSRGEIRLKTFDNICAKSSASSGGHDDQEKKHKKREDCEAEQLVSSQAPVWKENDMPVVEVEAQTYQVTQDEEPSCGENQHADKGYKRGPCQELIHL